MKELSEEALAGLSAGILGTVIGYPLDTVKTRMQTSSSSSRSILATASHIVRNEGGVPSLYKGVVPPLISLSILNTLNFASYSYFQHFFGAHRSAWDVRNAAAAAAVGPLAATVSTVENLLKTQLQLDNVVQRTTQQSRYKGGARDCARQLVQTHGWMVLYHGHAVNTVRETVFLMTYFFLYEGLRHQIGHWGIAANHNDHNDDSTAIHQLAIPVAGGLSGALAWTVSFPLDCVRAGVQGQDLRRTAQRPKTAAQVLQSILHTKGLGGLYHGVAPSIARAFLVSGSRFSAYETTLYLLRGGREVQHHGRE